MDNTVAAQIRKVMDKLPGESARLDAELLLAYVLGKSRSWLLAWPEKQVADEAIKHFDALVQRRLAGEPVAYLLGEQEFWSMSFQVNPDTLVPRPDTEVLVEAVLATYTNDQSLSVLDAGTGSGAIAITLAKERPQWNVIATDYSSGALAVAMQNVVKLGAPVSLLQADWLTPVADAVLDLVVSNPPYVSPSDPHLAALAFEPRSALVAENNGLADIDRLLRQAERVLRPGGAFYVEHGYDQGSRVRELFIRARFLHVVTGRDYAGNERFTCGVKPL